MSLDQLQAEVKRLRKKVHEQSRQIKQLSQLAFTDPLTGLPNRRQFEKDVAGLACGSSKPVPAIGLMMVDIDDLKKINDQMGHPAGDQVLQAIADILTQQIQPTGQVYRIGGDEFAVLIPDLDHHELATRAQQLIQHVARQTRETTGQSASISIGIAQAATGGLGQELVAAADQALYRAKREGGNRAC